MNANQPHPLREELFAYRDGELKPDRRVVIEAHVLGCHACRELIDDVSRMEADLGAGAPAPKEAYFERLTDQVMTKVMAADTAPAHERRRPAAEVEWEEKQALKPKLPWFALASTMSAAAAVIVVGVLLVREGAVWRRPPSVAVLERSAPDAARSRSDADSAGRRVRGIGGKDENRAASPTAPVPLADSKVAAGVGERKADVRSETDKLKKSNEPAAPGLGTTPEAGVQEKGEVVLQQQAGEEAQNKESAARDKSLSSRESGDLAARAAAPQASLGPSGAGNAVEPMGAALKSLLDRYGLPRVWGPGVSDDQVLQAEPALRRLYWTGGAATAADSARVRLYLAEAARVRAGAAPDSAAIDEIVHHYRRAIRLAGNDAEIRRVAADRLADFLNELGDEPALHSPQR